jgi:CheY-like chemotaxis protein
VNDELPSVLVVDDDADSRSAVGETLRRAGFEALEAEDGRRALDLLLGDQKREPSAIILDLVMPVMSGWELLTIVKSYHRLASIPIIVLSGHDVPTEALRHGAIAEYLRKPHDPDGLTSVVRKLARHAPSSGKQRTAR